MNDMSVKKGKYLRVGISGGGRQKAKGVEYDLNSSYAYMNVE
jgi:hypothetical protein